MMDMKRQNQASRGQNRGQNREQSQRQLKMGELIRHVLSEASLREDLHTPMGEPLTLTFTEVRCSADLRLAKVFYIPLGGVPQRDCEQALKRALPYLQAVVAKKSTAKFTPKLSFIYDTSFDQADRLRSVLEGLPEASHP